MHQAWKVCRFDSLPGPSIGNGSVWCRGPTWISPLSANRVFCWGS